MNNYDQLYTRNSPIIEPDSQRFFKNLKVAVAGCGSTGGAFIDGLIRLGVSAYNFSDVGYYELNNLNRQMVFLSDLGKHKAEVQKFRVLNINSEASVNIWTEGVNDKNAPEFLSGVDFLFDAVDVTTQGGMAAKLNLHLWAHKLGIPTGSALDLGYTQWLQSYNYQKSTPLLLGHFESATRCKHPLKALIEGWCPIKDLPLEIILECIRLVKNPNEGACQLGSACFMLSAMVTPYLSYFAKKGVLPGLTTIDLLDPYLSQEEKDQRSKEKLRAEIELTELFANIA